MSLKVNNCIFKENTAVFFIIHPWKGCKYIYIFWFVCLFVFTFYKKKDVTKKSCKNKLLSYNLAYPSSWRRTSFYQLHHNYIYLSNKRICSENTLGFRWCADSLADFSDSITLFFLPWKTLGRLSTWGLSSHSLIPSQTKLQPLQRYLTDSINLLWVQSAESGDAP